jgi:hypothetical protein
VCASRFIESCLFDPAGGKTRLPPVNERDGHLHYQDGRLNEHALDSAPVIACLLGSTSVRALSPTIAADTLKSTAVLEFISTTAPSLMLPQVQSWIEFWSPNRKEYSVVAKHEEEADSTTPVSGSSPREHDEMTRSWLTSSWRTRRLVIILFVVELGGTVAGLALFGISAPNTFRTNLWKDGAMNGFNSDLSLQLYAYANHRPVPPIPLIWSQL